MPKTPKETLQAIPTNIVTGFLGVGKTTAISHLLQQKPSNERWAVLVNEFGEVGIDGSLFSADERNQKEVFISEVPGGCMCCAAGLPMQIALNLLLAKARPHRLLIEPTGLGHPKEVMQVLQADYHRDLIALNATITMVDARKLADRRYTEHDTFNQQLEIADVVVANKTDLYGAKELGDLHLYLQEKFGHQAKPVFPVSQGAIDPAWLEGTSKQSRHIKPPANSCSSSVDHDELNAHESNHDEAALLTATQLNTDFNDQGYLTIANQGEGFFSRGWVFKSEIIFDSKKIRSALLGLSVERVKGVFITYEGVIGFNIADEVLTEMNLDDALDSRIELIADDSSWFDEFEQALLSCISS